jgi:hypothetical protein
VWKEEFVYLFSVCVCATKKRERMAHLPPLLTFVVGVVVVKTAEATILIK